MEENKNEQAMTNNKLKPHMAPGRNRTQATLVGGERSHHCAIPAPHQRYNCNVFSIAAEASPFRTQKSWLSALKRHLIVAPGPFPLLRGGEGKGKRPWERVWICCAFSQLSGLRTPSLKSNSIIPVHDSTTIC